MHLHPSLSPRMIIDTRSMDTSTTMCNTAKTQTKEMLNNSTSSSTIASSFVPSTEFHSDQSFAAEAESEVSVIDAKYVRFSDDPPVVHTLRKCRRNQRSQLYITAMEQARIGASIRQEARKDLQYICMPMLEDIHKIPIPERIERIVQLHMHPEAEASRGLEKELCPALWVKLKHQRKEVTKTVLSCQDAIREQNKLSAADMNTKSSVFLTPKQQEKAIASVTSEKTHSARCMARVLALADQQYVRDKMPIQEVEEEAKRISQSESDMFDSDDRVAPLGLTRSASNLIPAPLRRVLSTTSSRAMNTLSPSGSQASFRRALSSSGSLTTPRVLRSIGKTVSFHKKRSIHRSSHTNGGSSDAK